MKKFIINHFNLFVFIIFAVAIFGLYSNSLFFDWTFYDDDVLILDKQNYLSFSNIKNILTDTVFGLESDKFCRPVLNLSFLFEKYLYGINPFGYHLTNILLHLFCVFFLYLTLALRYDKKKTFVLCLLFAIHPVLVQAISWIPGRNDTLLTLFIILSFYFLIKFLDTSNHPILQSSNPQSSSVIAGEASQSSVVAVNSSPFHPFTPSLKKKTLFFSLHLLFFSLALFTKETAIIAPLFYILFLIFYRSNHLPLNLLNAQRRLLYIVHCTLYIAIASGYLLYRSFVLGYQTQSVHPYIFIDSFITSFPAITKYIANILFPIKLTVFSTVVSADYILCALVFLVFALLFLKFREYKYDLKIILFGFLWFLLFLVPTFILPYNQFYDHRIYLSLAGILLSLSEIIKNYNENFSKKTVIVLSIIFILFFMISFTHSQKFKNRDLFWVNALIDCPQSDIANSVVAGILVEKKAYALAEEYYMKAISINKHSKHYVNLAVLYMKTGRFDEAEECLLKAMMLDEYNPEVYYNLTQIYKVKGDMEKARYMKNLFIKIFRATNKISEVPELKL